MEGSGGERAGVEMLGGNPVEPLLAGRSPVEVMCSRDVRSG